MSNQMEVSKNKEGNALQAQAKRVGSETSETQGLAKAEIESQIATAKQYPRNIAQFRKTVMDLATSSEETAASCFYCVPRAGGHIEGASIRLAEIACSCFKNLLVQGDISHRDDDYIYAVGIARDLENNVAVRQVVRRKIRTKHGKLFSSDMIGVTGNAAVSIAIRNAIFRVVPRVYIEQVLSQCKAVVRGNAESLQKTRQKALLYLQQMEIDEERVLKVLGRRTVDDITRDDISILRGSITAIKDGEAKPETAFPELDSYEEEKPDDLDERVNAKATRQSQQHPKSEQGKSGKSGRSNIFD